MPINRLSAIKGTPLENQPPIPLWDQLRMIATARIIMPKTFIRLSAGRIDLSFAEQALCFFAGANSIFAGDQLLTIPNQPNDQDDQLFKLLGLVKYQSKDEIND